MKQSKKSENRGSMRVPTLSNLELAQKKALDDSAAAFQSIIELEKLAVETNQPNIGNVQDAKEFLKDAVAYLAIFASNGGGSRRIKKILLSYGLEELF